MEIEVLADPRTGELGLRIVGTDNHEEGKRALARIQKITNAAGLKVDFSKIEQHRHGPKQVAVVHTQRV